MAVWLASRILPSQGNFHTFEISGRLDSMEPWSVAGIAFETREWTDIQPGLGIGDLVHVEGVIQEDGTWVAYTISKIETTPYPAHCDHRHGDQRGSLGGQRHPLECNG